MILKFGDIMRILTVGELLVDLTQTGTDKNGIPQYSANPGGAPANAAVAASLMGAETAFIGKVGDDSFGRMLADTLKSKNVDISGIIYDKFNPTTLAVVSVDPGGERNFSFYRGGSADVKLSPDEINTKFLDECDILHFGSVSLTDEPSASAVKYAVKYAKQAGKIISYDPNYRPLLWNDEARAMAEMRALLKFVDIIKASDEEALMLTGENDIESAARNLHKEGIGIVLVTLGEKGAYYLTDYAQGYVPAFTGKTADTNGAGDTFLGTFLTFAGNYDSLLKNENGILLKAVEFSCAAAGLSTGKSGAIPSMPSKEETESFIAHYRK